MFSSRGDRYELLEVIGSGGMGTVWKARDRQLDRTVALKRPHPLPPGDPRRDRLAREARLAASVSHPNLVEVYDAGLDEQGPFLVMQFVDAPSLRDVGPALSRAQILSAGAQVAQALAAIHRVGVVHRDVKPANVLMPPTGAKLVDFGVALAIDSRRGFEPTAPGLVLGTAGYTAPEVAAGGPASTRSDVFGLGVVIAELLSGATVVTAGSTRSPSLAANDPAQPILSACMADDPDRRPDAATVANVLDELSRMDPATSPRIEAAPVATPMIAALSRQPVTTMAPPDLSPTVATPAPPPDARPDGGRISTQAVVSGGFFALVLLVIVVAMIRSGAAGSAEESDDARATLPTTVSTVPATTTTAPPPAPPTTAPDRPILVIPVDDPDAVEELVYEILLEAVDGSDEDEEDVEEIAEEIADKVADASEAVAEGKPAKARRKLEEGAKHARRGLDGMARTRVLAALDNWAGQLGVGRVDDEEVEAET